MSDIEQVTSKNIELKHGFKYHFQDDEVEAKFITISAFSMKQMGHVAPVKEIVMKAMKELISGTELSAEEIEVAKANAKKKKEVEEHSGAELMSMVAMNCGEGDYGKLLIYMEKLLSSGVAYIESSSVKLNGVYIPDMNPGDFELLCGEYIANFITL